MAADDRLDSTGNRDDAADSTEQTGNVKQGSHSHHPDEYDEDLARDNRRGREGEGMSDLAESTRAGNAGFLPSDGHPGDERPGWRSHARQGQAESPVELNHNEPPKKKEGHH